MNMFLKKFSAPALVLGSVFFAACSDDSSSSSFSMDESFEITLSKMIYEYNSKDSSFIIKQPICKEGALGNLVWRESEEDPEEGKAYLEKGNSIKVEFGKKKHTYTFNDDGKFPVGFWMEPEVSKNKILRGTSYEKGEMAKEVFRYDGQCFAQDLKNSLLENNESLVEYDSAMTKLYMMFKPDGSKFEEDEMMSNLRVVECDELSLYDDLVSVRIEDIDESSGIITVGYDDYECPITFAIRYAYNEEDCKAAYEDYKADKTKKEFKFKDFWKTVSYDDEYCLDELVLNMKREQGIPKSLKKSSITFSTENFANSIVDVILSTMR